MSKLDIMVVCERSPVFENVFTIESYSIEALEYLHVDFSLVVRARIVWLVLANKVPVGWPLES